MQNLALCVNFSESNLLVNLKKINTTVNILFRPEKFTGNIQNTYLMIFVLTKTAELKPLSKTAAHISG